jgi:hypothetical protein
MRIIRPAILLLLVVLTIPLRANIGETVAECAKRYGRPIGYSEASAKSPFGTLIFVASKYTLIVFLMGDKEVGARVSKTDKSAFTDAEMQTIMQADSDPQAPWTSMPSTDPTCLQWARADKSTIIYDKDKHMLIFTSPEMANAIRQMPPEPAATTSSTKATPVTNAAPAQLAGG